MQAHDADNKFGLAGLAAQAELGNIHRGIESEGVAADMAQFEEERQFPYKNLQFLQSLLSGLPISSQSRSYVEPSDLYSAVGGAGTGITVLDKITKALNQITPTTTETETDTNTLDEELGIMP